MPITGIEVGGIALATASITFQIFAGCVQGFKLLSSAHHLGKDAEIGLSELHELLHDTEKLKKRYKLDVKNADSRPEPAVGASRGGEALHFLNNDAILKEQEMILSRAKFEQKENAFPKRLWWAAVDRKGFEGLIGHIGLLIQRLFDFSSIVAQEDMQQEYHLLQLALVNVVEKLEDIRLVTEMLHEAVTPDETLTTVAALRALHINLASTPAPQQNITAPTVQKRLLCELEDLQAGFIGAVAKYEGVPVFVERKRYSESDIGGANAVNLSKRVRSLSILLNVPKAPSFRALHCIGSFQDPLKFEYVYIFDRPLNSRESIPPRSLLLLLRSSYIPSQTHRFRLASELATTLLHLHASGWLHKGFRSDSILFFPATKDAPRILNEPYIMGYEYARHDKPGELSEKPSKNPAHDVYRHPRAQGPVSDSYIKAFDIYSLGIILIEIAYWRAFGDLVEKMGIKAREVSPGSMQKMRETILDEQNPGKYPQNLRFKMGDDYTKVILCCLGTIFEDENLKGQEFITAFFELVVQRLKSCKV